MGLQELLMVSPPDLGGKKVESPFFLQAFERGKLVWVVGPDGLRVVDKVLSRHGAQMFQANVISSRAFFR